MSTDPFGPVPADVDLDALRSWIVHEDEGLLVVNKPGWLVCHPSKRGPRSSLVGACRELTGLDRLHLVSRLDRETSGLIVLAKDATTASKLQTAVQKGRVDKRYVALLEGRLDEAVEVDAALAGHPSSIVRARVSVSDDPGAKPARTHFEPRQALEGLTLVDVRPRSGRKHQIRAHAAHIGHPVAGDKIYGPDEGLFLEFITRGWTERMSQELPIQRQALHLATLRFLDIELGLCLQADLPDDMSALIARRTISAVPSEPRAGKR